MDYYKILYVKEDASQEEIKNAYKMQVDYFKREVKDPNKLNKFIELFDKALNELVVEDSKKLEKFKREVKESIVEENQYISVVDEEISNLFKEVEAKEIQRLKEDFTYIKSEELIKLIDGMLNENIDKKTNNNDKKNEFKINLSLKEDSYKNKDYDATIVMDKQEIQRRILNQENFKNEISLEEKKENKKTKLKKIYCCLKRKYWS